MIGQECSPSRGRRLAGPRQISGHRGLRHRNPQLEQFSVNAGGSPQRAGVAHAPNQVIKSRIFAVVFGLPGGRPGFHVQYKAKALRCQAMTVAGCTICRHRRQPDQNRDNRTHNTRSEHLRRKRRGAFACSTASWSRRARISVCSAALLRKLEAITAQRPTRTEFMMVTTMISRMIVNYAFADRTEYSVRTRDCQDESEPSKSQQEGKSN
jgi:hypothetical protein